MSAWLDAAARALFRRVVKLYPREFRDLVGEDMCRLFESRRAQVLAREGSISSSWFTARAILSALFGACAERLAELGRFRPRDAVSVIRGLGQDFAHGARSLRTSAGFATVAVVTLGLGIGVNATLFSLVNTVLFSELPASDPDRFGFVFAVNDRDGVDRARMSLREYGALRGESRTLSEVAAIYGESFVVDIDGEIERVQAGRVSDNYHRAWGVETLLGRRFLPGEDEPGATPIAILSHGFWDRRFGKDPNVLGELLRLDDATHTIVGVLSPRMEFGELANVDLWVPLRLDLTAAPVEERRAYVQARLAAGATMEAAGDELTAFAERSASVYPASHAGWTLRLSPVNEEMINEEDTILLLIAGLSVAFVLLIACANVANMLMARASMREKELAVRLAMGASRARLVRQLLAEGCVLAGAGAVVGLVFTRALLDGLIAVTATNHWLYRNAAIDGNVFSFTLVIAALTPLLFGLLPSIRASGASVIEALSEGGRSHTARAGIRMRQSLVVAQVAMALVSMIVTGLLVRTVIEMRTMDLGFDADSVLSARIALPSSEYGESAQLEFYRSLLERVRAHSDVESASLVELHPFEPNRPMRTFAVRGRADVPDSSLPAAQVFRASEHYFRTMRTTILRGRGFTEADAPRGARVAVVSETAASRYWPEQDPVGQSFRWSESDVDEPVRIVGIAADVLDLDGDEASREPQIYLPFAQWPSRRMVLVARVHGAPDALAGMVRTEVANLDPDLLVDLRALDEIERELFQSSNAILTLFIIFAGFALAMAAVGIYGVMAFAVSLRRREISIRMALGANAGDVLRLVGGQGARLVAIGACAGVTAAVLVSRALESIVVGVSTTDPLTFGAVLVILAVAGLAANYWPARRATAIEPSATLRAD